jgi:uncharacterized protein
MTREPNPVASPLRPRLPGEPVPLKTVLLAFVVVFAIALVSDLVAPDFSSLAIGVAFLYAPFFVLGRRDDPFRRYGLGLGGAARGLAVFVLTSLVVFPLFVLGFHAFYQLAFDIPWRWEWAQFAAEEGWWWTFVLWQLVMVALTEEFFFRGFVQVELDAWFPRRWRVLGADVGVSMLLVSLLFALGHLATSFHAARLLVFFPSLLMCWLRARSGSLVAPILFHASANLAMEIMLRVHK